MELLLTIFLICVFSYIGSKVHQCAGGYKYSIDIKHVKGITSIDSNIKVKLEVFPNKLSINSRYNLNFSQIKSTQIFSNEKLTEKNKSILARSVAGGLVLGGLGAVIGAISGVGNDKIQQTVYFLNIDFINSKNEEDNILFMLDNISLSPELIKISNHINEKIGCSERFDLLKINKSIDL